MSKFFVICLDDDEETTFISTHRSDEAAQEKLERLNRKFPNGAFDIVSDENENVSAYVSELPAAWHEFKKS